MQVTVTIDDELLTRLHRFTHVDDPAKLIDAGLRLLLADATMCELTRRRIERVCEEEDPRVCELRGAPAPNR